MMLNALEITLRQVGNQFRFITIPGYFDMDGLSCKSGFTSGNDGKKIANKKVRQGHPCNCDNHAIIIHQEANGDREEKEVSSLLIPAIVSLTHMMRHAGLGLWERLATRLASWFVPPFYTGGFTLLLLLLLFAESSFAAHSITYWPDNKAGALSLTFDDGTINQYSEEIPASTPGGFRALFL